MINKAIDKFINRCGQVYKASVGRLKLLEMRVKKVLSKVLSRVFANPWKAFKIKAFHHQTILTTPPHLV